MFDFTYWKHILALVVITLVVSVAILLIPGCATPAPNLDLKVWAGDSKETSVTRRQSKEAISCSSPDFDKMICMSYEDLGQIYLLLQKCRSWDL